MPSARRAKDLLTGTGGRQIRVYGFPGERTEDYHAVLALLPMLEHLEPPTGCSEIMIDRFSPYFSDPARFGIGAIAPFPCYLGLYPADAPLRDIAYHFNGQYSTPFLDDVSLVAALRDAVGHWQKRWSIRASRPILRSLNTGTDGVAVVDTRRIAVDGLTVISRAADAALRYLERPRSRGGLPAEMEAQVDLLLDRHFVVEHEGALLSVVTRPILRNPVSTSSATPEGDKIGAAPTVC